MADPTLALRGSRGVGVPNSMIPVLPEGPNEHPEVTLPNIPLFGGGDS